MPKTSTGPITAHDPSRTLNLLSLIAQMGGAPVAAALQESFLGTDLSMADRNYLSAGALVGKNGTWEEGLPHWCKDQVHAERRDLVLGRMPGHRVAPTDITNALYANSMAAPLQSQYAEIYLWATCHVLARKEGISFEEMRGRFGPNAAGSNHKICRNDDAFLSPQGEFSSHYAEFASDLRRRLERIGEVNRRAADKAVAKARKGRKPPRAANDAEAAPTEDAA